MTKSDLATLLCLSLCAVQVASTLGGVQKKGEIDFFVKPLWFDYSKGTLSGGWSLCKL